MVYIQTRPPGLHGSAGVHEVLILNLLGKKPTLLFFILIMSRSKIYFTFSIIQGFGLLQGLLPNWSEFSFLQHRLL